MRLSTEAAVATSTKPMSVSTIIKQKISNAKKKTYTHCWRTAAQRKERAKETTKKVSDNKEATLVNDDGVGGGEGKQERNEQQHAQTKVRMRKSRLDKEFR